MSTAPKAPPQSTTRRLNVFIVAGLVVILLYLSLGAYTGLAMPLRLVKGTSMEPALKAGDIVLLKAVPCVDKLSPCSEIQVGDVVAFDTPEPLQAIAESGTVLHRVAALETRDGGPVLITKGDNSGQDSFPVPQKAVRGKMTARFPLVGWPLVFITSQTGVLFVSIAILLTLLYVPAMAVFYMTVLRKPQTDAAGAQAPELERVVEEQANIRVSLQQLSEAIAVYAVNIKSHTAVVQNLAAATDLLRSTLERSSEAPGGAKASPSAGPVHNGSSENGASHNGNGTHSNGIDQNRLSGNGNDHGPKAEETRIPAGASRAS